MWDLIVSVPDHCLSFYYADIVGPCSWLTCSVLGMGVAGIDAAKVSNG